MDKVNNIYTGVNFDNDAAERKQKSLHNKSIIDAIQDNTDAVGVNTRINNMKPYVDNLKVQYGEIIKGEISLYNGNNADNVTQINRYGQDQDIWIYLDSGNKGRMYPWAYHVPQVYLLEIVAHGGTHLSGGHIEPTLFSNATNINQINRIGLPLNNNTITGTYGKLNLKTMTYTHGDKTIFESVDLPNNNQYFTAYSVTEPTKTTPIMYEYVGPLEADKIPSNNAGKFLMTYFFDIETGVIVAEFIDEFNNDTNPDALQSSKLLRFDFNPEMKAKVTSGKYGRYTINSDHAFTISIKNPFDPHATQQWLTHEGQLVVDTSAIKFDPITGNTLFNDAVGNKDISLDSLVKGHDVTQFITYEKTGVGKHEWFLTDGHGFKVLLAKAIGQADTAVSTLHATELKLINPDNEYLYEIVLSSIIRGDGDLKDTSYINIYNSNGKDAGYNIKLDKNFIELGNHKIIESINYETITKKIMGEN